MKEQDPRSQHLLTFLWISASYFNDARVGDLVYLLDMYVVCLGDFLDEVFISFFSDSFFHVLKETY